MSTSPRSLFPTRSYEDEPDYIDEKKNEVRINRKRPNERRVGRFTIIDEISPPLASLGKKKSKKWSRNKASYETIYGKTTKDVHFYPGQKIGRFTIKSVTKSQSPKIKLYGLKRIVRSPKNSRSPKVQIGRFTIRKKSK